MEQQPDERYELYQRFKNELSTSPSDMFYDEKELVEIYDIAGDYDDDYVRMEVLLQGFRLYPDSEDLAVRRGYFYYDINVDEGVRGMLEGRAPASLLWELMRIRTGAYAPDEIPERFATLLDNRGELDDEEIIQLVDCASSVGEYAWLKDNLSLLRKHCSYLPTLLYEMQVVAAMNQDEETAVRMLEELTEIEPFNSDFWCQLSDEQLKLGNLADAETSADYAMAIDATDYRPAVCKAKAILAQGRDFDKVIALLEPWADKCYDDLLYIQAITVAYINENQLDKAQKLLLDYNGRHPDEKSIVDYLLMIHYPDVCDILDTFYASAMKRPETEWIEWAQSHRNVGQYAEAALILECFDRNQGIKDNLPIYFGALYEAKFYRVLTHFFTYYMKPENRVAMLPELAIAGVMSFLRLGMREEALNYARELLSFYRGGGAWSVSRVLASIGLITSLSMIVRELERDPDIDIDDLDTFTPPESQ